MRIKSVLTVVAISSLALAAIIEPRHIGSGFTILRLLVTSVAIWQFTELIELGSVKARIMQLSLIVTAIVFNPIVPFYVKRDIWVAIDIVTMFVLLSALAMSQCYSRVKVENSRS